MVSKVRKKRKTKQRWFRENKCGTPKLEKNKSYYEGHKAEILSRSKTRYATKLHEKNKNIRTRYTFKTYLQKEREKEKKIYHHEVKKKAGKKPSAPKKFDKKSFFLNLRWINTETCARKLTKKLNRNCFTDKILRSKAIIKWCLYAHKMLKKEFSKKFLNLKTNLSNTVERLSSVKTNSEELDILCGKSLHTSHSEPYFHEFSYKVFTNRSRKIAINDQSQAANIFNRTCKDAGRKHFTWSCDKDVCNVDSDVIINTLKPLFNSISKYNLKKGAAFSLKLNDCSNKHQLLGRKLHTLACYEGNICKSILPYLKTLGPHFPQIRNYIRLLYDLHKYANKMNTIKEGFLQEDVNLLNQIAEKTSENAKLFNYGQYTRDTLVESEILATYKNAFKAMEQHSLDTANKPCVSCEKLFFKRQVSALNKLKSPITGKWWNDMKRLKQDEMETGFICRSCLDKFRQNNLPATCVLNNLECQVTPKEIACLNSFEKILIQRAKAFQVVMRKGTVANRRLPVRNTIQHMKGRTFHLPLPLQETLKRLPNPEDPININHELFVLVRGVPTKSKVIWESLVNVHKVYDALKFLKSYNVHYKDIKLPENPEEILKPLRYVENILNVICDSDQGDEELKRKRGILTQVDPGEWEDNYQEFTIHALNEIKVNEPAANLYQMLRVTEEPIHYSNPNIDVLCFPDLYFEGIFGQCYERKVKLTSAEYIKSRLMSKNSQFRLNQQYLFYLLHDANVRQLRQGIFHKLNVSNVTGRMTADECLKNIANGDLEGNLTSIFSKLRNTSQYWVQPRNDVQCMTHYYGTATWFLTVSPSEWNWDDLSNYILDVNVSRTNELNGKSTSELVAFDPVSASRFIDNKFHSMLEFILSKDEPLGKVIHYFYRREYQSRGLQHFHMLLWVEEAPILGQSTNEEVAVFVQKYVTCQLPTPSVSPTLYDRVKNCQTHSHNSYCMRNKKTKTGFRKVCRFGFPRTVSDSFVLRNAVDAVARHKALMGKSRLYDLKRTVKEQSINDYNAAVLLAWDGNVDIQYVGEHSSILTWYVTKYTTKSENSHAIEIFNEINTTKSLSSRLFNIGIRALNNRECGALEASDTLLSIPLYGTDPNTTIRWLDVNMISKKRLKNIVKIRDLDADSTDLFYESWVDDYYPKRPQELEKNNLYDFVRWFDVRNTPLKEDREVYVMYNSKLLVKRNKPYLINHYKYSYNQQPEKYYFSLLLMFKPWRNTNELKGDLPTYMDSFFHNKEDLLDAVQFDKKLREIQMAVERTTELIQERRKELEQHDDPDNATSGKIVEIDNKSKYMQIVTENTIAFQEDSNIMLSLEVMLRDFNTDQLRVFNHITSIIKNEKRDKKLLRMFVSGVGGTGKSFFINVLRIWIKEKLGGDLTAISAPTGLSANNVSGNTIYKLFQLPVEHGKTPNYRPLSDEVLKILRTELKNVILFVIDEISMVSNLTLMYIHLRLSEIFATNEIEDGWFGKKHILVFGDLLQLPPVHEESPFIKISEENMSKYIGALTSINIWTELFTYDELTINMRQEKDPLYGEILNRIRVGIVLPEDKVILEKRKISILSKTPKERLKEICNYMSSQPFETICLCATSYQCAQLNEEMLNRIQGTEIILVSKDSIECQQFLKKRVNKLLATYDNDSSRTAGMEKIYISRSV